MTANFIVENMRKAKILQDQVALSLFMMPNEQGLFKRVCEYLSLCHEE